MATDRDQQIEEVKQRLWNPGSDEVEVAQLTRGGYDGLYSEIGECACEVSDLYPCGERGPDCLPGYKTACSPSCGHDHATSPPGPADWHIASVKSAT